MNATPLVSIVVNNYNYAEFLKEAVESALAQTWPHTEVIVVDDGSTDDSRDVIAAFGDKIIPVLKENEGQASAFNAGFARSRGQIVVFLDADDALLPHAVENAVEPLREEHVVKVHWPLWEIDAEGKNLGRFHKKNLIEGDFREEFIRRGPVSLSQSPTSGNAWVRWFLEKVMPLPEHADKHGADGFLKKLCPVYGAIRRLDEPQGFYRLHPSNYGGGRGPEFEIRRGLRRFPAYCRLLAEHLQRTGVSFAIADWVGPKSQYAWLRNFVLAFDELAALAPPEETVVLINNDDLGSEILPGRTVLSLHERDGEYHGPPPDAACAVERLEQLRADGGNLLVLAFSAFWWIDAYPEFFTHLRSRYACLVENDRLLAFDLRRDAPAISGNAESETKHTLRDGRRVEEICREVLDCKPSRIQPLGEAANQCRAFKVRVGDKAAKIFECENAARAEAVRLATEALQNANIPIPAIIDVIDHVVVAEWVKGTPLNGGTSIYSKMATYQARIHQAPLPPGNASPARFPHLDWLLDRLHKHASPHVPPDSLASLADLIRSLVPPGLKTGIVQPDYIKSNIVVRPDGELVIVDNEFIGIGTGFEFDILNTSHAVSGGDPEKRRQYLAAYEASGDTGTLAEHGDFWELCYLTKFTGKTFANGDPEMGAVCLDLLRQKTETCARECGLQ